MLLFFSISMMALVITHLYLESKIYINWCRIDAFFLLGFLIVHFQWPIMFSFNNIIPDNLSRIWIDSDYVNYGTWISTIGGISWLLGYSLPQKASRKRNMSIRYDYSKLLYFTTALFFFFILTAGKAFLTGAKYIEGDSNITGTIASYINILLSISLTLLTVFIVLENKKNYKNNLLKWILRLNKLYLALILSYILIFLAAGDRGGPIAIILTLLILIGAIIRPIRIKEFLILTIIGSIFMTLISIGRAIDSDLNIINSGYENLDIRSGYDITLELANSIRTLYMAISEVPSHYDYFYGELWSGNLLSVVPFAQSIYVTLTNIGNEYLGSAEFITYLTFGKNSHTGEGTTLIADIFLNFGAIGVVILMFLFGYFVKKANLNLLVASNINWIIIASIVGGFSLYFGRSSIFVILRPIFWSFPLVYVLIKKYQIKWRG
jgi:hypothetical protein